MVIQLHHLRCLVNNIDINMSYVLDYYAELPNTKAQHVLILGGHNHFVQKARSYFTDATIYSIDHRPRLDHSTQEENSIFLNYFFDEKRVLPFRKNTFDIVIIPHYIRDILYRESLVKSLSEVIKNQGHILIVESFMQQNDNNTTIRTDDILEYLDRASFELLKKIDTNNFEYGIIAKRHTDAS